MSFSGSMSATRTCSSILWMLAFSGPNSTTCGGIWLSSPTTCALAPYVTLTEAGAEVIGVAVVVDRGARAAVEARRDALLAQRLDHFRIGPGNVSNDFVFHGFFEIAPCQRNF